MRAAQWFFYRLLPMIIEAGIKAAFSDRKDVPSLKE